MDKNLKQRLKARAHPLKPVILLGAKGLTPAVIEETRIALSAHELIKVKLSGVEKAERTLLAEDLCQQLQAELVQLIGHTVVIYRQNPNKSAKKT